MSYDLSSGGDPKSQILDQIRQATAANNARAFITKLNESCFERCVPSPGTSLSKKEEGCLSACMEKYMATWNTVSKTYMNQAQKTAGQGGGVDLFGV
ncbi:MAG: hypothetical protein LQ346_008762 [Caloplaca aetnensis]|nr:MAG: hypothetical protein LQ346_008762 [Caloplaca aetnensis]